MENKDILFKQLFQEMPEEQLPAGFTLKVMQRVKAEAVKAERRKIWLNSLWLILASGVLIALAIYSFYINGVNSFKLTFENPFQNLLNSNFIFYLFIGALAGILLVLDYRLRKFMRESGKM